MDTENFQYGDTCKHVDRNPLLDPLPNIREADELRRTANASNTMGWVIQLIPQAPTTLGKHPTGGTAKVNALASWYAMTHI